MKRSEIENKIRHRIFEMEEEVDVQKIMASIPAVTQKSRKGILYWWLGASVGILLIGGMTYYTFTDEGDVNIYNSKIDVNRNTLELNDKNQNITTVQEVVADAELRRSAEVTSDNKIVDDSDVVNMSSKVLPTSQESLSPNNESADASTVKDRSSSLLENAIKTTNIRAGLNENANIAMQASMQNTAIEEKSQDSLLDSERQSDISFENSSTLNQFSLNELDASLFVKEHVSTLALPKTVDCPTFGRNPWEFELGALTGLSNPTKALAPKNNQDIPAYPSRAINEKSLEGLDLELFLSAKRARWPVFIKSGINYSRWSERMTIDESYTEVDTVQGIISTTVSQSGDTITYIYGDIYVERDYQINKSIHYFLHRFDIPLSIVYEGFLTDNQSLQAEVGTRINFSTLARGRIYNNDLEFSNASLPNFFRRFSGLSYFTKLHYRYYLSEQQFIGASAYFQHLPADFSTSTNQIEQRYLNYGLGVYYGMRF